LWNVEQYSIVWFRLTASFSSSTPRLVMQFFWRSRKHRAVALSTSSASNFAAMSVK
jgi:hypothetical protein